jgi:hypothetical protein
VITDRRRFKDLYEDLLARVDHGGRAVSESEQRELRARLEAWERNPSRAMPGEAFIPERPPSWERVATRLGIEPLAEPAAAAQAAPEHPAAARRERSEKGYDTGVVVAIVHRAIDLTERPRRAVRDRWYAEIEGATTPLIDYILELMDGKPLPPVRRERWQRAARAMASDGNVTRTELAQLLK